MTDLSDEKAREVSVTGKRCTGRVIEEHRERYYIQCGQEVIEAGVSGKIMYSSENRLGFPAVGDMVIVEYLQDGSGVIRELKPRTSVLVRRAAGRHAGEQILAANIDYAFVVMSGDEDFSLNRLDRYLTIIYEGGIRPLIILNKTDLLSEDMRDALLNEIKERHAAIPVIMASALTEKGADEIKKELQAGKIYCFIGSSGVGKSSLINRLTGSEQLAINPLSTASAKGIHTTTYRQLIELQNGSMLIDTPGLREVGLTGSDAGIDETFVDISGIAQNCRFRDCTHTREPGCAVIAAVQEGVLAAEKLENYLRLKGESQYYQMKDYERRQKDRQFGRMIKEYKQRHKVKK
jgi:ribosome biogenesis GTPase